MELHGRPLKIALLHPGTNQKTGGIVKAGVSYAEGLIAAGHEVAIWTASPVFAEEARFVGANVHMEPDFTSFISLARSPSRFLRLMQTLGNFDGVIHNNGRLWPIGLFARRSTHFVVFHNRSFGSRGYFRHWLAISEAQVGALGKMKAHRPWVKSIHRIRNGVAPNAWRSLPVGRPENHPLAIGFLAEIRPQKGLDILLDAASLLKKRKIPFRLRIGGDGRNIADYREQAARLELGDVTEWLGWINDSSAFLDTIDVLCLPSRNSEGFPLTLLEALARKVPIVATQIDGSTEIVNSSGGGLLFEADDMEGLADALEKLLLDADSRQAFGQQGYEYVSSRFRPVEIGRAIESAVRSTLTGG